MEKTNYKVIGLDAKSFTEKKGRRGRKKEREGQKEEKRDRKELMFFIIKQPINSLFREAR